MLKTKCQKAICRFLACFLLSLPTRALSTLYPPPQSLTVSAKAAVLMDQSTGMLLYEQEGNTQLPPASVTKIMTILLVMEALQEGRITPNEIVIVSSNAASMGGSQVYLKENETMELWELLKCVVVVSANDASVALAEHLYGSEDVFVSKMNERAKELGMSQTNFVNCTGLPEENHLTTAYDIALMSRQLMLYHPEISELSTIWMDTIRGGTFGLSNTNRLIHSYPGALGLKTGSTDQALYCLSAVANRENLTLIAVVLKSPTSDQRFQDASNLLDYGFANFQIQEVTPTAPLPPTPVILGEKESVQGVLGDVSKILLQKTESTSYIIHLPDTLEAPVRKGEQIGSFDVLVDGSLRENIPIYASEEVERLSVLGIFQKLFRILLMAEI
ncbi:MAG: D-alanyl-D-alanine carboxypeptidase family protein [Eubacteriales bacterium]